MKGASTLKKEVKVCLNVYDLIEANKYGAGVGIGAFHSGCEIDGVEYSFGLNDYTPPRTGKYGLVQSLLLLQSAAAYMSCWLQGSGVVNLKAHPASHFALR